LAINLLGDGVGTGGYNYLLNLVQAINAHIADRLTPVLFAGNLVSDAEIEPFRRMGLELVRAGTFDAHRRQGRMLLALLAGTDAAVARIFAKHGIDVVFESASFYGWRFPLPVLSWLTDFQHKHLPDLFSYGTYWRREIGFRAQTRSNRQIMVSSADAGSDCERFYPTSAGRISVVRFAVAIDASMFEADPTQVRVHYDLPEDFFYLPNQFWKHKNHIVVIEAVRLLKQRGRHVVVAMSGKPHDPRHPDHFSSLQARVSELGLETNFRFLGMVPRPHVIALMRACRAVVNPSRFEGWSTPVEEARSLGVPMLLSNIGVHREQMGDEARFFDAHSALQLADLLEAQPALSRETRLSVERAAQDTARGRVQRYALDFLGAIERTVARSPSDG
jgi:glycosyltransferase involved in cell wall biosynthesis